MGLPYRQGKFGVLWLDTALDTVPSIIDMLHIHLPCFVLNVSVVLRWEVCFYPHHRSGGIYEMTQMCADDKENERVACKLIGKVSVKWFIMALLSGIQSGAESPHSRVLWAYFYTAGNYFSLA